METPASGGRKCVKFSGSADRHCASVPAWAGCPPGRQPTAVPAFALLCDAGSVWGPLPGSSPPRRRKTKGVENPGLPS